MKNLLAAFAAILLLTACDPYHAPQESLIALKKDPCFGLCPVYTFKVDGKGNATFHGERNTAKLGDWTKKLSPEETNKLFEAFEKSDFGSFKDEYTDNVTDLPTKWVTYRHGEIDKTVKDFFGGPETLKELEKMVEVVAEATDGWTKTVETREQ